MSETTDVLVSGIDQNFGQEWRKKKQMNIEYFLIAVLSLWPLATKLKYMD